MKRLTPAAVSTLTFALVGLLATAYFAKLMHADEAGASPARRFPVTIEDAPKLDSPSVPAPELIPPPAAEETAIAPESGMRAVPIALPRKSLDEKLMRPGRCVDVYLTPSADDVDFPPLHNGMTLTLFDGVRLLTINPGERDDSNPMTTVTLELSPEQANILILAREKGTLALSYNPGGRGGGGIVAANRDRATLDDILGISAAPKSESAVPPAESFVSQLYKGSARTTLAFPDHTSNSTHER